MEVICLEDKAYYALIERTIQHFENKFKEDPWLWVDGDEAMLLLNITSKTTLQKLRNEGKIRFSQPQKKVILYDRHSINEYLNKNAQDTF